MRLSAVSAVALMCFGPAGASAQALREETIAPVTTDPAIAGWTAHHVVIVNTSGPARNQLFLYLHGAGGTGGGARDLLRTAAREGFYAIGLTYPNDWVPFTFCAASGSAGSDCYDNLRHEIIDGTDLSPHIAVSTVECVSNRVRKLLIHLAQVHPTEAWPTFLDDTGSPRWDRVVVWGHSQGGANAAVLARHYVLGGVCMSGQATDFVGSQPATWWSNHLTPSDRYFGFCHTQDQLSAKVTVWAQQGMAAFGPVSDVASVAAPYGDTHQLSTSVAPAVAGQYHNSVVADSVTPRDGLGNAIYAPVWRYMILGAAAAGEPGCRADFDSSGAVSVQDIFSFLAAYFDGSPSADFDSSGGLSVQDIFDFLAAYFAGCA